jgi:Rrf2 family protein
MLSRRAKYGLKALIYLADHAGDGPVVIEELSRRESIPRKFLEQILLELKKHGLLFSRKGRGGGYELGKPPEQIAVGAVVRILDGPLAPVPCVSVTAYMRCAECPDEKTCGVRLVMKDVRDAIAEILDNATLADVVRRVRAAREERA